MNAASREESDIPAILTCLDLWSMRFGGKPLPQTLHTHDLPSDRPNLLTQSTERTSGKMPNLSIYLYFAVHLFRDKTTFFNIT